VTKKAKKAKAKGEQYKAAVRKHVPTRNVRAPSQLKKYERVVRLGQ